MIAEKPGGDKPHPVKFWRLDQISLPARKTRLEL